MNEVDAAYAAGLYEGEGSTSFSDKANRRLTVEIGMTDREPLDRFARIFDWHVLGPYKNKSSLRKSHKPWYKFRAQSYDGAMKIVTAIWPYLSPRRKGQITEAVHAYRNAKNPPTTAGG